MKKLFLFLIILTGLSCKKDMQSEDSDILIGSSASSGTFYFSTGGKSGTATENILVIPDDFGENYSGMDIGRSGQDTTTPQDFWERFAKLSNQLVPDTSKIRLVAGVIKPTIKEQHIKWGFPIDLEGDSIEFSNIECISENKSSITRKR